MRPVWAIVGTWLAILLGSGCSGESQSSSSNVSGRWCGAAVGTAAECVGDEVEYLELSQAGDTVTGVVCEAYGKECYDVQAGLAQAGKLTLFYTFSGERVDVALDVGNATLAGTFTSTKCACSLPITLHRIP